MNTTANIMSLKTASGTKTVSGNSGAKSVKKSLTDGTSSNKSSKQDSFSNVLDKSTNEAAVQNDTVSADEVAKDPISAAIASAQQNSNDDAAQTAADGQEQGLTEGQNKGFSQPSSVSIEALMGNSQNQAASSQGNQLLEMLTGGTALLQNLSQNSLNTADSVDMDALIQNLAQENAENNSNALFQNVVLKSSQNQVSLSPEISDSAKESMANLLGDAKVEVQTDNFAQANTTGQQQQAFQQGEQTAFYNNGSAFQDTAEQPMLQNQSQNTAGISAFQQTMQTADVDTQQVQETQQPRTDYDIPKQIVEQARLIRSGENTEMVIRLRPEHLGNLTLRISVTGNGAVNATFHSDNAQVRAIIESSMVQLKQDLESQGLKVNNVEVYSGLSDGLMQGGQSQSEYQQQQSNAARHSKLDMDSLEDDMEQLNAVAEESSTTEDGVDYRV